MEHVGVPPNLRKNVAIEMCMQPGSRGGRDTAGISACRRHWRGANLDGFESKSRRAVSVIRVALKRASNDFSPEAARCGYRWRVVFMSRLKPLLQKHGAHGVGAASAATGGRSGRDAKAFMGKPTRNATKSIALCRCHFTASRTPRCRDLQAGASAAYKCIDTLFGRYQKCPEVAPARCEWRGKLLAASLSPMAARASPPLAPSVRRPAAR